MPPQTHVDSETILHRDAEDAIHDRDGYNYDGYALKVEHPRGGKGGGMGGGRFGYRDDFDARGRNGRSQGVLRRSDYRVLISGALIPSKWPNKKFSTVQC